MFQNAIEEVLKSPVTLDFLIDLGDRIEAGEASCGPWAIRDAVHSLQVRRPASPKTKEGPDRLHYSAELG
jgi:hypothetical protein